MVWVNAWINTSYKALCIRKAAQRKVTRPRRSQIFLPNTSPVFITHSPVLQRQVEETMPKPESPTPPKPLPRAASLLGACSLDTSRLSGGGNLFIVRNHLHLPAHVGPAICVFATSDTITPEDIPEAERDPLTTSPLVLGPNGELAAIPILLSPAAVLQREHAILRWEEPLCGVLQDQAGAGLTTSHTYSWAAHRLAGAPSLQPY